MTTPFSHIARWDGSIWTSLGGVNQAVNALAVLPDGDLLVGGEFYAFGDATLDRIARWNPGSGMWSSVGPDFGNGEVHTITVSENGEALVGGDFGRAGGVPASNFAVCQPDTGQWSATSAGISGGAIAATPLPDGDLVIVGYFSQAGDVPADSIARWDRDTATWSSLRSDFNNSVFDVKTLPNGDVVVGGAFTQSGTTPTNRVAMWNGAGWAALGSGITANLSSVHALPSCQMAMSSLAVHSTNSATFGAGTARVGVPCELERASR